jgi:hypothetical protein
MKLVSVFAAILTAGFACSVNAQNLVSGNILSPTVNSWTGTVQGQNGGYSGGTTPAFNPNTNTIIFGYTTATAAQTIAINQALSGTGIQVGGYNYSWSINNDPATGQYGTLTGSVVLKDSVGNALQTYNYNYLQQSGGFIQYSGTESFPQNYSLANLSNLEVSFTGKDARFWAGYYGPQVRNPSITLNYTVDPCAGNPAYSPSCPNYNTVVTSPNLLAGVTGPQAYAINQALSNAGAGATIHGFNYGYDYNVAGRSCAIWDLFGFCLSGWNYSDAGVSTVITDSNNATLFSESNVHNGGNNGISGTFAKQFRFGASKPISTLGGFAMAPWTSGNASITNMHSSAVYTADPCLDPLSSPSCSGYAAAYLTQQCNANPLYNSACPGYAQAYFTQQCTVNALYDPACPGYASAYLTYQCSINPLYSTTCSGYAAAYKIQQCTASPLYATDCPGYEQAYLNSQCIKDSLYSTKCEGYATAYAIKYLTPISSDSSVANAVNGSLSDTAATKANDPATTKVAVNTVTTSINTDGSVSTGVSATGDTNVDKAITHKASTTNTAPAAVQLAPPPPPPQQMAQNEPKGGGDKPEPKGSNEKQEDRKDDAPKGSGGNSPSQNINTTQASSDKPAAPTTRQAIQERREAAAKAEAVEKGKNLANEMGKAADMETQKAVQNVVIQAMGFTPGFDVYNKTMLPDVAGYKPYSVYNNQKTVDNERILRGMSRASDKLHESLVDSQYK